MTMLGLQHSQATREKMRISAIKRGITGGYKKLIGKKRPSKVIQAMRATMFKKGFTPWNKGKHYQAITGPKHPQWKGGITSETRRIRTSLEYKLWRKSVFERDNYTCVACGARSGKGIKVIIHADHVKPFAYFPELRFAIDNGRTLCKGCHLATDTYGNRFKHI